MCSGLSPILRCGKNSLSLKRKLALRRIFLDCINAGHDLFNCFDYIAVCADTHYGINLGDFLDNFFLVSLRKATRDNNLADNAFLFQFNHVKNIFDGFFFCVINKAAGVNDNDVTAVNVINDFPTLGIHHCKHMLGINLIFGAAERNHSNFVIHKITFRNLIVLIIFIVGKLAHCFTDIGK